MCNKANMVRRFYVLMMTRTTSIESICVGVMKTPPTDTQLKEVAKKYLDNPISLSHIELQKVYVVPVDIPVSILF